MIVFSPSLTCYIDTSILEITDLNMVRISYCQVFFRRMTIKERGYAGTQM